MANKPKILIVDDDTVIRTVLAEFFADNGFEVYASSENKGALYFLQTTPIDIVITDINHPDPNGLTLARLVNRFFEAKVIILSGALDSFYSREECHRAGAVLALRKPQQPADILDVINKILKKGPRKA